jgi:hypothetical protein
MPQQVGMDGVAEACSTTSLADHLADAALREASLPAEPQELQARPGMLGPRPEVPIDRRDGSIGDGHEPLTTTLAEHPQAAEVEVDVSGPLVADLVTQGGELD